MPAHGGFGLGGIPVGEGGDDAAVLLAVVAPPSGRGGAALEAAPDWQLIVDGLAARVQVPGDSVQVGLRGQAGRRPTRTS